MSKVRSGLSLLDKLLDGGIPLRTAILLSGGPGTGKTLFALNFLLAGASAGEKCCFLSVNEDEHELLRAAEGIEQLKEIKKHMGKNLVIKKVDLGEEMDFGEFSEIFKEYPTLDRLVIDNVNKLLITADGPKEYRKRLAAMLRTLKQKVGCTLLLCETNGNEIDTGQDEAFDCDGVIHLSFLEFGEKPLRTLEIRKMRYCDFGPMIKHELLITKKSIDLTETKAI